MSDRTLHTERKQSKRALARVERGGFFLRKNPLSIVASGYGYSGFGDITRLAVDAIVNAANTSLLGGGGVDGAIHSAAGAELLEACRKLNGCATGDAKATPGFQLPAKWVFHAVGPIWRNDEDQNGERGEDELLASCYRRCLQLAGEHRAKSIAFPAISTGVYGFPARRAAEIALQTVKDHLEKSGVDVVQFVCFNQETLAIYTELLSARSES
jgi:O-acetyl-ADP-ribose deacetylase